MWHEDDQFWREMAPFVFDQSRWAEAAGDVEQIVELLDIAPPASVLDLCCGPGRHSLELAKRGFSVVGVDRTTAYLDEARRRAEAEHLKLELVREDMRRFCRPDNFDAVLSVYTSFGYFEDEEENRHVLENMYRSLKPGGKLVIDVIGKEVLARIFRERDWNEQGGMICLRETKVTRDWSWLDSGWILLNASSRQEFKISHHLYGGSDLRDLLRQCGFEPIRILGDFAGTAYDQKAKRLIAVAGSVTL